MATQSWRGPGPGRPALPLPPERMPLVRGGRPLKSWRYVGAYGPDLMLCAARGRIGPVPFSWWAVWDGERLHEGRRRPFELELAGGAEIEVVSPHGRQYAWTCKRPVRARGRFEGRRFELPGIVDESAGYHARHTAWRWSAGVGTLVTGEPVAWNLVDGIHDAPEASERTVWVAGEPREVPPVRFDGLSGVAGMRFTAVATRARRENLLLVRSDYEQPFGTFAGELPGAGELREGWGVMERHDVRW
jgi:Protein of unknown function (DUF2804)